MSWHGIKPSTSWAAEEAASQPREVILSFSLVRSHLGYCIQFWGFQHKKDMDLLRQVQRRATKVLRDLEHLSYKGSLKELGSFSLPRRRLQVDLMTVFHYIKGTYEKHFPRSVQG